MQKHTQKIYAWLYSQLEYTNRAIAPILTAFRFRSIKTEFLPLYKNTNQSPLGKRERPVEFDEQLETALKEITQGYKQMGEKKQFDKWALELIV